MNDKQFSRFIAIILVALVLWWLLRKRTMVSASGTPLMWPTDPELLTYASDPSKFGPQTVNGSVQINVNGYNGINQNYMPLFGFVGMAQGEIYQ